MLARDIMTRPVVSVRLDTLVRDAAALLTTHQVTAVPVLDDDEELVGIVSESDLLVDRFRHSSHGAAQHSVDGDVEDLSGPQRVEDVMTTEVVVLGLSADIADIAETMLRYDVRSLPIVEGNEVFGIVSRRDLLRILVRDDDVIQTDVSERLTEYGNTPRDHFTVTVHDGRVVVAGDIDDDAEAKMLDAVVRSVPGVRSVSLRQSGVATTTT
jgi:CBS domain-containing protein